MIGSRFPRKESLKILTKLEKKFIEGEKMTKDQLAFDGHYLGKIPMSFEARARAKRIASNLFFSLARRLWNKVEDGVKLELWFGCLNDLGQYGIPVSEEEIRFIVNNRATYRRGQNERLRRLLKFAQEKNILPEIESKPDKLLVATK